MAACQITTAAVVKSFPVSDEGNTIAPSGIATVALIYLFVIAYNFSWGPMPWPYVSEYDPISYSKPRKVPIGDVLTTRKGYSLQESEKWV